MNTIEQITTRQPTLADVKHIQPLLQRWMDPKDIEAASASIDDSIIHEGPKTYTIAQAGSDVIGIMGVQIPSLQMSEHAQTENPLEIVRAYVMRPGQGIGGLLLRKVTDDAYNNGYTEFLVNSGPRYRDTGWQFWTSHFGEPVGTIPDLYGPTRHAQVWQKAL